MGLGWIKGKPRSEETKRRISESTKGRIGKPHSLETRKKISEVQAGKKRRPLSEDTKNKISQANKGKVRSPESRKKMSESHKNLTPWNNGKHLSDEHKQKLSDAKKGKYVGENNPSWKGGLSKTKDYRNVFKRNYKLRKKNVIGEFTFGEWEHLKAQYGHRCPVCGREEPEIKLTADHVIPITKGGCNNICNIQPLCVSCNSKKQTSIYRITPDGNLMLF